MVAWDGEVVRATSRLFLRTFRQEDLSRYAAMNADPIVAEFLGGPITREESDGIAEWAQELFARERIGLLAIERRSDGSFLGMCGLHHLESFPNDVEVAWRLARPYWGHGYATEAAASWLEYGFEQLQLPRVISIAEPGNLRSIAVMRRLAMEPDHERDVEEDGERFHVIVHSITVDQWRARRNS
jgi:RimJ/RimL family protein N-acetyltransferase